MGQDFPLLEKASAPAASLPLLEEVEADFGMIPNLERMLSASPPALAGYVRLWELFENSSFNGVEKQVVYQTANFENNCTYCVPWHSFLSQKAGMKEEDNTALRAGTPLSDPKLEALRLFTKALIDHRGHPPEEFTQRFFEAGYTAPQALEVVLGLATKLMSNYANGIAHTPLDSAVASLAWEKPPVN